MNIDLRTIISSASIALFTLLFGLLFVVPLQTWRTFSFEKLADKKALIEHLESTIIELETERAELLKDETTIPFWEAETLGQVTATVQSQINNFATQSGVSVRSITPLGNQNINTIENARFRVEFEARLDALTAFTSKLEFTAPLLIVQRADLRRVKRVDDEGRYPLLFGQLEIAAPIQIPEAVR